MTTKERTGNLLDDLEIMTIDELREELKGSIEFNRYILTENWKEKEVLRSQIKEYEEALKKGGAAMAEATATMRPVFDHALFYREAFNRWKFTSYALAIICTWLCFIIYNGGAK